VSKHGATEVTPFELVFGQEVVLPMEVNLQACRTLNQDALSAEEYTELMMDRIDDITEGRLRALKEFEREKLQTARAYNKRVREKHFRSENWFGRQSCHWKLGMGSLANGHLAGKAPIWLWV
jgi:hypothetical protein